METQNRSPITTAERPNQFLVKNLDLFTTLSISPSPLPLTEAEEELNFKQFLIELVLLGDFDDHILLHSFILIGRFLIDSQLSGYINFKRLLTVALFVTQKYFEEDEHWFVEDMAILGKMTQKSILKGEIAFLEVLEFKVHVKEDERKFYKEFMQLEGAEGEEETF